MLKRELYLRRILPYVDKDIIKVLIGVRRSGKSSILLQIMDYLKSELKIEDSRIIYINLELIEFDKIRNYRELYDLVKQKMIAKHKYFIFIDEIQQVNEFERAIVSLKAEEISDIYITGSNSKILSSELSTRLSGRYIEFRIYPFNFYELHSYYKSIGMEIPAEKIFLDYVGYGGIPQLLTFPNEVKDEILKNLYSTIVLKDIIERYRINDVDLFQRIMNFIVDNISNMVSGRSISDYMRSSQRPVKSEKVYDYLRYCVESMFIDKVHRFDIKGKTILSVQEKYYLCDVGFRKIRLSKDAEIGKVLENIIYLELRSRDFQVYIGKSDSYEVDFVAEKAGNRIYIQVAYLLSDQNVIDREFRSLELIDDNYPKFVVSMDNFDFSRNGVVHKNIIDFISNFELLDKVEMVQE